MKINKKTQILVDPPEHISKHDKINLRTINYVHYQYKYYKYILCLKPTWLHADINFIVPSSAEIILRGTTRGNICCSRG